MVRDLVKAVAFIHANNIVHRDIKPSNVLISNLHYTKDTMQEAIISCPIVCKLRDLGEARSKILQTRNTQNPTKVVNRGSIPFQAPETLVDEVMLPAANNYDLKNADRWSLLMSLFIILNPG